MPHKDPERRKQYQREWVKRNRGTINITIKKARDERTEYIRNLKKNPCVDCGNSFDPRAMDFHHKDGNGKGRRLADASNQKWTYAEIDLEVAKCELICSNCHRIRH